MELKKLALPLTLSATFGLIACGSDESSSSINMENSCKVIDEGKTVGYEYYSFGVSKTMTTTFNGDGTATYTVKEKFSTSVSKAELEMACAEIKKDMTDEDVQYDSYKCEDGLIEVKYTDKDVESEEEGIETAKKSAEIACAMVLGEEPEFSDDEEDDGNDDGDDGDDGEGDDGDKDKSSSSTSKDDKKSSSSNAKDSDSGDDDSDNDGGNSSNDNPAVLPECTSKNEGEKTTIIGIEMVCTNGDWEIPGLSDSDQPCEDGATKTESILGYTMDMICVDGEWEEAKCTDGDTKQQEIFGMTMDMVCIDGSWEEAKCTDGDTKTESFLGISVDMVCVDGEWESKE